MTWRAVLTTLVILTSGQVAAQDRPPAPELPVAETAARPPEKPAAEVDAPKDQDPAPAPSAFQGPPAPPAWYALAETDAEFAACRLALSMLGTTYKLQDPLSAPDDRDCGIARPLRVSQIVPGVTLTGDPVMRCDTARALGFWTRDFLRPAAALMDGAPRLTGLQTGPAYSCRDRVGTGADQPKQSEHAYGSAVDIMAFDFDDGASMSVQPRVGDGNQAESFLRAARGTACLVFTTVLGPGANAAHDNHLHLDMAGRTNGWRLCE
ncbi:MAG: extensin family protein [Paracoccus sp. (in: a-proteobacteria)]|nr:extensin family protein [Paracoccus sp. (in: a-proteobacteria)]